MNIYLLQIINGVGIGMLYFLLAVGLSIVFGLLRFVNFAHGAFYLIGAYACYQMTRWGVSYWLTLLAAPLLVGALGWLTEKVVLRHVYAKAHEFHILVTVGLALAVQELVILQWGPLGDSVAVPDALQGVVMWIPYNGYLEKVLKWSLLTNLVGQRCCWLCVAAIKQLWMHF